MGHLKFEDFVIKDNFTLRDLRSKSTSKNNSFLRMLVCSILLDYKIVTDYAEVSQIIPIHPDSIGRIFRKYKKLYRYDEQYSLLQLQLLEKVKMLYNEFLALDKLNPLVAKLRKENALLKERMKLWELHYETQDC